MRLLPLLVCLLALPALARAWRDIDPGVSRKAEVLEKFGEPSKVVTSGEQEILAYMGKRAIPGTRQAQFKVDAKTGVVDRIDVFPGPVIPRDAVEKTYGPACPDGPAPATPCYVLRTAGSQKYFLYPRLGLAVFFDATGETVASLVFQPSSR